MCCRKNKEKKYTKPTPKISPINPVVFYGCPSGRNWFSVRIYETNTVTGEAAGFCEGYLRKCKYVTHLTLLDVGAESGGM